MADAANVVYTAVEVLIALCCVFGNALVIHAVRSTKSLQQPTFSFVVSLAVADFMVGCVSIPLALVMENRLRTPFHTCLSISCLLILPTLASVLSLLAIAFDRFLRVYSPLRYRRIVTQNRSWLVVAVSWIVAVALSFTPLFGWHKQPASTNSSTLACEFVAVIPSTYLVYFIFFLCNLMPLLVMAVLYGYIFCAIQSSLRDKPGSSCQSRADLRKERHLAGSLSLVLALFALFWLPLNIMNCIAYFGEPSDVPKLAFYVGILLSHANSAVNPLVYALKIPKIKTAYLRIWMQVGGCRWNAQRPQMSQTTDNLTYSNPNSVDKIDMNENP